MLPLLLLWVAAQVPAVPGEGTLVSFCKQGRLTACQELAKINPQKAAEIQADEPPNCKGQKHHIISRLIAKALEDHKTLRGLYGPRDERLKARAKDKNSHCGYQTWHREVDTEVVRWLEDNPAATPAQFMMKLREIYNRPDMLRRFPHGF